jgi:hypothetical protein
MSPLSKEPEPNEKYQQDMRNQKDVIGGFHVFESSVPDLNWVDFCNVKSVSAKT